MINRFKKVLITVAALAALALGGSALAGAASNGGGSEAGDKSEAITGSAKTKAEEAALAKTGSGKVTESELDNENGATYEVEVTKPDGSQVDVRLDGQFKVVAVEADGEDGGKDEGNQGADQNPDEAGHQDEKAGAPDNEPAGESSGEAAETPAN